jgi:hypothetical protein
MHEKHPLVLVVIIANDYKGAPLSLLMISYSKRKSRGFEAKRHLFKTNSETISCPTISEKSYVLELK